MGLSSRKKRDWPVSLLALLQLIWLGEKICFSLKRALAMQADILGAATLGIKNILCLTGDHMSFGNHPEAKGVHDLDAINLIKMYKDMRDESKFQCGEEMTVAPPLYIGCAENPFADPFELRALRL